MKMRPSAMRGAPVMDIAFCGSVAWTSQTFLPLPASTAMRRPSSVPQITFPFHAATPRFTMAAAELHGIFTLHLRVVLPELFAGLCIKGIDLTPGGRQENPAVDDDRRRLVAATALCKIAVPGEAPAGWHCPR